MITTKDKLPLWFKIVLLFLVLSLAICIIYIRNSNINVKLEKTKSEKTIIVKKIDSLSKKNNKSLDDLVENSKKLSIKATDIIKKLPYEKPIVFIPGDDTLAIFISNYRYTK